MTGAPQDRFAHLLHGTARAWRQRLDDQLKPLGMSQARWRTLLHLSIADEPITQAELASRLGVEEPTLVNLLHRLEEAGWLKRIDSPHDRRCKTVKLQPRATRIINEINRTATKLRTELLTGVSASELETCIRVLERVCAKAETPPVAASRRGTSVSKSNGASR